MVTAGNRMKSVLLARALVAAFAVTETAIAGDTLAPIDKTWCDPYKDYSCLELHLGQDLITRRRNGG